MKISNPLIYLAVLALTSTFLCFLCIHEGHVWGDDFALYIAQAQSLLNGTTADLLAKNTYLTANSEIIEGGPIGPYLYPIGFPLLLSGVYARTGLDFVAMKFFCSIFFIAALPLLYHLFSTRFTDKKYSLLLTAYTALNFVFVSFSDNILSDFPLFFLTFLSMYLIDRNRLNTAHQLLLSFTIIASYLMRDVGIFFIPVLIVQLFFKAHQTQKNPMAYFRESYMYLLPIAVFGAFWLSKNFFIQSHNGNLMTALLTANAKTIVENTAYYVYILGELLGIKNNIPLGLAIMLPFCVVVLRGMYLGEKRDAHFILLILLTVSLYVIFPGRQGIRYLFPIIPFVFYFFMQGILSAPFSAFQPWKNAFLLALGVCIGANGIYSSFQFKNKNTDDITTPEAVDVYNYLKSNTKRTDIIVFEEPRLLRLMTERNGFMHHDDLKIRESAANYLLEKRKPLRNDPSFTPLYQNKSFIVYSINR